MDCFVSAEVADINVPKSITSPEIKITKIELMKSGSIMVWIFKVVLPAT